MHEKLFKFKFGIQTASKRGWVLSQTIKYFDLWWNLAKNEFTAGHLDEIESTFWALVKIGQIRPVKAISSIF